VSVTVPPARAEEARATMLELFPAGFEEVDHSGGVELIAYTDAGGEERLWHAFGTARGTDVEAGWEERWRSFHQPVRVGPLWVGPPWIEPPADALAVVIEPGRAFGTGAHPTTRLCLECLLDLERGSLLDVGCGSGVLAIAAVKLGFAPVVAVDLDPNAVEATRANARANGVAIDAQLVDAFAASLPPADLAVANIAAEAVAALGARLASPLAVTSGYLEPDEPELIGYERTARKTADGWAADVHRRRAE
jgi:ribosomal protein L11 methyltransferase